MTTSIYRLVGPDGEVVASATAAPATSRVAALCQPLGLVTALALFSTSNKRLYFLAGPGPRSIGSIDSRGAPGPSYELSSGSGVLLGFAISGDDALVGYSTLELGATSATLHLFSGTLGAKPVEIFTRELDRRGQTAWPVGWYGGKLVLRTANVCSDYQPHSYHVVDPVTAARIATFPLSDSCEAGTMTLFGAPSAGGAACQLSGVVRVFRWSGATDVFPIAGFPLAFSSNGDLLAYLGETNVVQIRNRDGSVLTTALAMASPSEYGIVFLDSTHLLFGGRGVDRAGVYNITTQARTTLSGNEVMALGTIPGGLD